MSEELPTDTIPLHSGYHGWSKNMAKTDQDFTPIKIDTETIQNNNLNGSSAWNIGGTWEERDKSEWAKERMKNHILESFNFKDKESNYIIKVKSIVQCDGDAKVVFSRGKKRCGYDMFVKVEWVIIDMENNNENDINNEITGNIEVHDFEDTTGEDYEIHVSVQGNSEIHKKARDAVLRKEPEFRDILSKWKQDLLEQ